MTFEMETFNYSHAYILDGRNYSFPRHTFIRYSQKYVSCQSHVYMTTTQKARQHTVYYNFQSANARRESPKYIILWNCCGVAETNWKITFSNHRFFGSFMDIRLYVSPTQGKFTIGVICMICASMHLAEFYTGTPRIVRYFKHDSIVDHEYVEKQWLVVNKNHYGHSIPIYCTLSYSCLYRRRSRYKGHVQITLVTQIRRNLNLTLGIQEEHVFYIHGLISLGTILQAGDIYFIYARLSPRLFPLAYGMRVEKFSYFTLIHKKLLRQNDWLVVFVPFVFGIWYAIAGAFSITVFILYRIVTRSNLSESFLRAFAPLMDQYFAAGGSDWGHRILFMWACLCMSLTVIYGGELASSLTLQLPPAYPQDLSLYDKPNYIVFTSSTNKVNTRRGFEFPAVISTWTKLHRSPKSGLSRAFGKSMLNLLQTHQVKTCHQRRYTLSMNASDPHDIIKCSGKRFSDDV